MACDGNRRQNRFLILSAHLLENKENGEWSDKYCRKIVNEVNRIKEKWGALPVILNGDWFFTKDNPPFAYLVSQGYAEAGSVALTPYSIGVGTSHDLGSGTLKGGAIDLIFVNPEWFTVLSHKIILNYYSINSSDHLPVMADLKFSKPATEHTIPEYESENSVIIPGEKGDPGQGVWNDGKNSSDYDHNETPGGPAPGFEQGYMRDVNFNRSQQDSYHPTYLKKRGALATVGAGGTSVTLETFRLPIGYSSSVYWGGILSDIKLNSATSYTITFAVKGGGENRWGIFADFDNNDVLRSTGFVFANGKTTPTSGGAAIGNSANIPSGDIVNGSMYYCIEVDGNAKVIKLFVMVDGVYVKVTETPFAEGNPHLTVSDLVFYLYGGRTAGLNTGDPQSRLLFQTLNYTADCSTSFFGGGQYRPKSTETCCSRRMIFQSRQ